MTKKRLSESFGNLFYQIVKMDELLLFSVLAHQFRFVLFLF